MRGRGRGRTARRLGAVLAAFLLAAALPQLVSFSASAAERAASTASPDRAYQQQVLQYHPLIYLPLDDPARSSRARDLGRTEEYAKVPTFAVAPRFGVPGASAGAGTAALFRGDSLLDAGDPKSGASLTLELWIRAAPGSGGQLIDRDPGYANGAGPRVWQFRLGDDGGHVRFIGLFGGIDDFSTNESIESARPLTDSRWHMVAVTLSYDRTTNITTMELVVDGRPVPPVQHSGRIPSAGVPIGIGGVAGNAPFGRSFYTGAMQNVALLPRPLTVAQIAAQYAVGSNR